MAGLIAQELPKFQSVDERVDWMGERIWDIAEGDVDREDAVFLMQLLAGWADNPLWQGHEREQLEQLLQICRATIELRFGGG